MRFKVKYVGSESPRPCITDNDRELTMEEVEKLLNLSFDCTEPFVKAARKLDEFGGTKPPIVHHKHWMKILEMDQ